MKRVAVFIDSQLVSSVIPQDREIIFRESMLTRGALRSKAGKVLQGLTRTETRGALQVVVPSTRKIMVSNFQEPL